MSMIIRLQWVVIGLLIFSSNILAWPVGPRSDEEILNAAQLVVVARIKPNSLKSISHQSSFETEAVLQIARVIKGTTTIHELPIMISYGVLPVPKNKITKSFGASDAEFPFATPYSYNYLEPIPLFEFNPDGDIKQVCDDIRKEQVWFLSSYRSITGKEIKPGTLGVLDFRDVQPLSTENKFKAILK